MSNVLGTEQFLVTKEHRRFVEFCDACRRYRYIGLCYGPPGVGKTMSARAYAQWAQLEALDARFVSGLPPAPEILACRTVIYTPPVANTLRRIELDIHALRLLLNDLIQAMPKVLNGQNYGLLPTEPDVTELIMVDEADRLKTASLEQLRDIYDRSQLGLILIGMPGLEKRLARYSQLYSRVGFVHHFKPLSTEELHFVLQHKWQQLDLTIDLNDFTDVEAVAAISRITGGNFRLLQRLFSQIERVMQINSQRYVTKEVVEAARELLVVGPT
jgi:DNA transposition AAA+ family ATPase